LSGTVHKEEHMKIITRVINKLIAEYLIFRGPIHSGDFTVVVFSTIFYNDVVKPGINNELQSQFESELTD
jgi:hypothetical protein